MKVFQVARKLVIKFPHASTGEIQSMLVKRGLPMIDGRTIAGEKKQLNNFIGQQVAAYAA